ncbi:MAG: MBOAT family protein [Lachnospiraceae bacterium]|nr:MBOAT family protein [Lachnospiraceae bacterium]
MMFDSISFIILFPAVVIMYRLIPEKFRYIWLLVVSCAFYASAQPQFLILLLFVTLLIYASGLLLSLAKPQPLKRIIIASSVVILIGILFVFKYLNFMISLMGSPVRFDIILPLGLSFYTFQAVSYVADVYRGRISAEKNILKLALYLSFFLSIVSGPINRAEDILPQLSGSLPSYDQTKEGMQKMLWGYFLKLAVAGRLNIIVENVYGNIEGFSGFSLAVTALLYIFMLYCDFEGYSQIATGGGYMLGIRMNENFRQPFFAESISQIWRRWHISLSTWFRDYLYIPLGGSRCGVARKYLNIFTVMFVSGIWHGADLSFFVWGTLFGIFMIAGQITLSYRDDAASLIKEKLFSSYGSRGIFDRAHVALRRIGVYISFAFIFIFFANDSLSSSLLVVRSIFTRFDCGGALAQLTGLGLGRFNLLVAFLMMVFVLIADAAANKRQIPVPFLAAHIPTPARWALYWILVSAILFSANLSGKEFIYSMM